LADPEKSRKKRPSYVLDASVAAKWFNNEHLTDRAVKVRDAFVKGRVELCAPEHLIYEVGNAIWKNKEIGAWDCASAITNLIDIDINLVRLDSNLASQSMRTARDLQVSYYDAVYIQLSDHLDIPLLSADDKLILKIKKDCDFLHLKDFE